MRWATLKLKFIVYWLEAPKPDKRAWLPVISLMAFFFAIEGLGFLWIAGAFRLLG